MKALSILGSTGSIGQSAMEVVERFPDRFKVIALAAGTQVDILVEQIKKHQPLLVSIGNDELAGQLRASFPGIEILSGDQGLVTAATLPEADLILSSTSGRSGLLPTFRAIEAGKTVALANKESLVMAGEYLMGLAREKGVDILPVDSEHNGVFRLMKQKGASGAAAGVRKVILTASGGPFLDKPLEEFPNITAAEALKHPTWEMGPKITIDSATLANKGLEVIEACWLFNCPAERIGVLVHPQSIVHSIVELEDGTWIAHLGRTDMKIPIHHALSFPDDAPAIFEPLGIEQIKNLEFREPDFVRFPALRLAFRAIEQGGTQPAVFSSANETANDSFRKGHIRFDQIWTTIEKTMDAHDPAPIRDVEEVFEADLWARDQAMRLIEHG